MKDRRRVLVDVSLAAALWVALPVTADSADTGLRVSAEAGNVVLARDGTRQILTRSGRDEDPALAPDNKSVVFTRRATRPADPSDDDCGADTAVDELHRIEIASQRDEVLLRGRAGSSPTSRLCQFGAKQFSSDGRRLYFLSPAWTTSAAVHVLDMASRAVRFVQPGNDLVVLDACKGDHRDRLVIQQHRYFAFGGSFDWYWLYDAAGAKEIAPVGDGRSLRARR
jgi:hypothetical protein